MPKERIYPTTVTVDNANFGLAGAATKPEAVDDPYDAPNDADYLGCGVTGQEIRLGFGNTSVNIAAGATINFIDLITRAGAGGGTESGQQSAGFIYTTANHYGDWINSAGAQEVRNTFLVDPADGLPFTKAKLDAIEGGFHFRDLVGAVDANKHFRIYIEIDYVGTPLKLLAARRRASARLLLRRVALQQFRGRF